MDNRFIQIRDFFISLDKIKYINKYSDDSIDVVFANGDEEDLEICFDCFEDREKEWEKIQQQLMIFASIPFSPVPNEKTYPFISTPVPLTSPTEITCY